MYAAPRSLIVSVHVLIMRLNMYVFGQFSDVSRLVKDVYIYPKRKENPRIAAWRFGALKTNCLNG